MLNSKLALLSSSPGSSVYDDPQASASGDIIP